MREKEQRDATAEKRKEHTLNRRYEMKDETAMYDTVANGVFDELLEHTYFFGNEKDCSEIVAAISAAVANDLSDTERDGLVDRYYHGLKMNEIAAKRGVNPSTTTRNIARAKQKLELVAMKSNERAWRIGGG